MYPPIKVASSTHPPKTAPKFDTSWEETATLSSTRSFWDFCGKLLSFLF